MMNIPCARSQQARLVLSLFLFGSAGLFGFAFLGRGDRDSIFRFTARPPAIAHIEPPSSDHIPAASTNHPPHSALTESANETHNISWPQDYYRHPFDSDWCRARYSLDYLASLRDNHFSYCSRDSSSSSSFDCFRTKIHPTRYDSFCMTKNVVLSHGNSSTSFNVACNDGTVPTDPVTFPSYMYGTGPGPVLRSHFTFTMENESRDANCGDASARAKFTAVVRREGSGNIWHSLLEIFSFYLTMDTLFISSRDQQQRAFLSDADLPHVQLLLLDDHDDGPYFDLWKTFAPMPILRPSQLPNTPTCLENVILPLAGGSNPLWSGDWDAGSCTHSELLDVFSRRVLAHYSRVDGAVDIADEASIPLDAELTLTFIDRVTTRSLLNSSQLLSAVKTRFPKVHIQSIDFAAIPFSEQLRIVHHTDILVGVHGAGLTHAMFLPESSSVVEIFPPHVGYKVFRNLAKLRGHHYASAHADESRVKNIDSGDWHEWDVVMEQSRFVELVEAGITAMLNRGTRSDDVV